MGLNSKESRGKAPRAPRHRDSDQRLLLECDNGTETLERLGAKLAGYTELAPAAGHPNWVLFTVPSPPREREASRVPSHSQVPVATAAQAADAAHWPPVGGSGTPPCPCVARGGSRPAMLASVTLLACLPMMRHRAGPSRSSAVVSALRGCRRALCWCS